MSDNELIAAFMANDAINSPHLKEKLQLQYDTSWDWLMPVVEKIDKIYLEVFPPGPEFVKMIMNKEQPIDHHYMDVIAVPLATPIKEVYESIVEFIKWYNQQKP